MVDKNKMRPSCALNKNYPFKSLLQWMMFRNIEFPLLSVFQGFVDWDFQKRICHVFSHLYNFKVLSPPHLPMTSLSLILRPSPTFLCSTNSHALRSHIPIQSPYLLIIFKLVTNPKLSKLPSFPYFSSSFLKLILPFTPFPFHTYGSLLSFITPSSTYGPLLPFTLFPFLHIWIFTSLHPLSFSYIRIFTSLHHPFLYINTDLYFPSPSFLFIHMDLYFPSPLPLHTYGSFLPFNLFPFLKLYNTFLTISLFSPDIKHTSIEHLFHTNCKLEGEGKVYVTLLVWLCDLASLLVLIL